MTKHLVSSPILPERFQASQRETFRSTILALCATSSTGYVRIIRGEVSSWRERKFVASAIALGASSWRVIVRHLLPQLLPPLAVQAAGGVADASLAFLGLGAAPPTPWGAMINEARSFLLVAPHLAIGPGIALSATVLGFTMLGDGLRDYFDNQGPATRLTLERPGATPDVAEAEE